MSSVPQSSAPADSRAGVHPAVPVWLFTVCLLIFCMVVLGGVTRLTHSGLSMVDWRPITGWLPPLTELEWDRVFARYQTSPEFRHVNPNMTVHEFKGIFWLEYLHRLLGRVIGLVFFVPFVLFLARGMLARPGLKAKCLIMFALGGLQGVVGWYMVKSGLVDEPDVSQYRLAMHLGLALVIYAYILWTAMGLLAPGAGAGDPVLRRRTHGLLGLVGLTILSGALVAGLDAGFLYNTFPLMEGGLLPDDAFQLTPAYLNFFEDRATVQFDHRVLAITTVVLVLAHWYTGLHRATSPGMRRALHLFALAAALQVALGIATLLLVVPIGLAALHQAGAVVLLTAGLWCLNRVGGAVHAAGAIR